MLGGSDCYDGRSDSSDYRCEFTYFSADLNLRTLCNLVTLLMLSPFTKAR